MTDKQKTKLEPEVEMAMKWPNPSIRRLAQISLDHERAVANMGAIFASHQNPTNGEQS